MPELPESDEQSRRDLKNLQGVWKTVSVEVDGSSVESWLFENATLVIAGDRFTLRNPLPDAEQRTEGVLRVDAAVVPKELVLALDGGQIVEEIYELENDTLKVCYPINGGNRPPTSRRLLSRVCPSWSTNETGRFECHHMFFVARSPIAQSVPAPPCRQNHRQTASHHDGDERKASPAQNGEHLPLRKSYAVDGDGIPVHPHDCTRPLSRE